MRWYVKCAVDNIKGLVPFVGSLRRLKHGVCGYTAPEARADYAIAEGLRMIEMIRSRRDLSGAVCLEIGTGWEPLLPILFSLAGAAKVYTADLKRLCNEVSFEAALRNLRRNRDSISTALGLTPGDLEKRLTRTPGESMEAGLRRFGVEYLAPCDCARTSLAGSSLDIVYSRDTLEHIPRSVLAAIFRETARLLRPDGLACHFVDPSDHWEHRDKGICRVNFLRYSDRAFRLTYINGLNFQNRLRHPEYIELLRECGFTMLQELRHIDAASLEALRNMKIDPQFRRFSHDDLATVDSFLLAGIQRNTA